MHKLLLGLLILVAALTASCGDDDDGGGSEATTAPASATGAAIVSPAPDEPGEITSSRFSPALTGEAPSVWEIQDDLPTLFRMEHPADATGPLGSIFLAYPVSVWSYDGSGMNVEPPEDLAAWVRGHPRLVVVAESPITIGGLAGTHFEVESNAGDYKLFDDVGGTIRVFDGDHFILDILNAQDGELFVKVGPAQGQFFDEFIAIAQPVVDSLEFTPANLTAADSTVSATEAELTAVVEATYPYSVENGYYYSCDGIGLETCPITERLRSRLEAVDETVNAALLCRCQDVSNDRVIAVTPTGPGGSAAVSMFGGTLQLEVSIIRANDGQLLVDDVACASRPETSLYSDAGLGACPE